MLSNFGLDFLGDGPVYERPLVNKRQKEIFYILSQLIEPKIVLEIGSWEGSSALSWGKATEEYNTTILCVDTWLGSVEHYENVLCYDDEWSRDHLFLNDGYPTIYKTFVTNIRQNNLQDRIIAIPIDSRQAFIILEKNNISPDICYIDAAHDYDSVLSDLNGAKTIKSGIICGDDYYYHNGSGIRDAVHDFANENSLHAVNKQDQFILLSDSHKDLHNKLVEFGWDDC